MVLESQKALKPSILVLKTLVRGTLLTLSFEYRQKSCFLSYTNSVDFLEEVVINFFQVDQVFNFLQYVFGQTILSSINFMSIFVIFGVFQVSIFDRFLVFFSIF